MGAVLTIPRLNLLPYYLVLFPGTVVHEFSHWVGCKLTLVQVLEFVPFSPQQDGTLGWVKHRQAGPIRSEIISFAPLVGGMFSLYALSLLLLPDVQKTVEQSGLVKTGDLGTVLYGMSTMVYSLMGKVDYRSWTTWVFLYFAFAIGRGMIPSVADLMHLSLDLVVLATIAFVVVTVDSWLGLNLAASPAVSWLAERASTFVISLNLLLAFSVVTVSMGALVIIPFASTLKMLRR